MKNTWISKILRLMLYVGVGLVLAVIVSVAAWYNVSSGRNLHIPASWVGLAIWTPVTFGLVVRQQRKYWHIFTFWMAVAGLLVIHLLAFTAILRSYPQWRPIWFMFSTIVECVLLSTVLDLLFTRKVR